MKREGTLTIVCLNHGRAEEPRYKIGFSDYTSRQVATTHNDIIGENELKKYLADLCKIHLDAVDLALRRLRAEGNAAIFHMMLTDTELATLGLK